MHKPGCGKFLARSWVHENFPEIVDVVSKGGDEMAEEKKGEPVERAEARDVRVAATAAEQAATAADEARVAATAAEPEITAVRRVLSSYAQLLRSVQGVVGLGASKDAIVVYVASDEDKAKIPATLDGVPVRVVVAAKPTKEVGSDARHLVKMAWPLNERDFNCAKSHILKKPHFAGATFNGTSVVLNGEVVGRLVRDSVGGYWFVPRTSEGLLNRLLGGERWGIVFEGPVRRSIRKWVQERRYEKR